MPIERSGETPIDVLLGASLEETLSCPVVPVRFPLCSLRVLERSHRSSGGDFRAAALLLDPARASPYGLLVIGKGEWSCKDGSGRYDER